MAPGSFCEQSQQAALSREGLKEELLQREAGERLARNEGHGSCTVSEEGMKTWQLIHSSSQFSSVAQSCLTLCDPMNCSMPGLPVHHQLPEFNQTHVH